MSCYYGPLETWKITYVPKEMNGGMRGVALVVYGDTVSGAHFTLDGRNGAVGVGNCLTLCYLTYQTFAVLLECNNRGGGTCAFSVGDNDYVAAFHNGYARVGGTKVDANDFCHNNVPPKYIGKG